MTSLRRPCAALCALALTGCVLPSFEEEAARTGDAGHPSGHTSTLPPADACGLSDQLPTKCDACIRAHCCDLAKDCGEGTDCGRDLLEPITPAADFSTDFDPLLGCMQRECDDACQVDWGCVGNYEWPEPKDAFDVDVHVIDFAAVPDKPLPDVEVQACEAIDPGCMSGRVADVTTGDDGLARLHVPADFDGFFSFSGGGYMDSTVQWSEPIYRVAGFKQFQLTEAAVTLLGATVGVQDLGASPAENTAGYLIFRVLGCLPARYLGAKQAPRAEVAGVRVSFEPNDGASQTFYTEPNGSVSVTLDATTSDATGGAFNVPARNVTVIAVDVQSGTEVARSNVRVQPGTIGFAYLVAKSLR